MSIDLNTALFVLAKMPIAMFCKNERHEYIWCNDAFAALLETKTEEILHKTSKELFSQIYKAVEKSDERVSKTGSDSYDISFIKKDGSTRKYLIHKHMIQAANGKSISFGIMLDITEKANLELEYKTAIETTKDGFWINDAKTGRILDVNDSYCKITGYTRDEVLSMSINDLGIVESMAETAERLNAIREHGGSEFTVVHRKKDGGFVRFEISAKYSSLNGGLIFSFLKDITEKTMMQEMLIESERLFMQFADSIQDVFWVKEPGNMLFINKAYEEMWGMKIDDIYTNPEIFMDSVLEEDRERVLQAFVDEIEKPEHIFDEEYRIRDKGGNIKWIHAKTYPIFDTNGNYIRNTGIAKDITAYKQLEDISDRLNEALSKRVDEETQKRKERELAFEGIFDIAGSCLCIIDDDGVIVDANRQFLNLFDMQEKKEELLGISFKDLLSDDEHERAERKLGQVAQDCEMHTCYCKNSVNCKKTPVPYEWRFKKKNGESVVILATVACFENSKRKKHYIASFTDITRLRELETKQKENERLLAFQSKMAAMGEMIGAIAHQWRQPLNLLGILIQDVQYCYKDGDINGEYIDKFTSSAMEQLYFMSKTIDDFRNFFKSDKELLNFDVYKNIEKSISLVSGMMKAHGVELELTALKKPTAKGLPNELGQVVLNLISNAKDALSDLKPNDPKIKITLDDDGQYAIIDVEDNGGGIKNEIIERIFEPYFTTKEEGKGTGIGLYMSKTIVEKNMSGKISVANSKEGAVFTVKIPLATP